MNKLLIAMTLVIFIMGGCTNKNNESVQSNTIDTPSIDSDISLITNKPAEDLDIEQESTVVQVNKPVFSRIDDNPAEFTVSLGEPFIGKSVSSVTKIVTEYDAYPIYYLDKGYLKHEFAYIRGLNLYDESQSLGSWNVKKDIEGNHIFISEPESGEFKDVFCSVADYKNNEAAYSLSCVSDKLVIIENDDGSHSVETRELLNDNEITGIKKFLEVSNNKICYQTISDEIFAFEMTTLEVEKVEDYELTDYSTVPEEAIDYTNEYILFYDRIDREISLVTNGIINGIFTLGGTESVITIPDYGEVIDVKAVNNEIFIVFHKIDNTNIVYCYSMLNEVFEEVFSTDKEFDSSLAIEDDYFAAFYGGEYNIEAIKYNFESKENRLIFDNMTEKNWWHTAVGETDIVEEEYRYADINYMVYKGNILFGFNIDEKGITTLVFKTDVIDRDMLPRP